MGFPSVGTAAFYRNRRDDVKDFFDASHKGAYKLYNLCSERTYDVEDFEGRVARYVVSMPTLPTRAAVCVCLSQCRHIQLYDHSVFCQRIDVTLHSNLSSVFQVSPSSASIVET
jgi:hypothetical protein